MRLAFYLALLAIVVFSCIDESDYQIDGVQVTPTLALPLVTGELLISDLLNGKDSAHIKVYPDGLIYLAYEQELKSQSIRELFDVPDKSVTRSFVLPGAIFPSIPVDLRTDSIAQVVDFGLSPEELSEIALRSGQITYSTSIFPPSSNIQYEVIIDLPDFISRTTNKALSKTVSGTGVITLDEYTLLLNQNKFNLKLVVVIKKNPNAVTITPGTSINVKLEFESLEFTYIKGFLGDQAAALNPASVEIGVFDEVFGEANISLADPKVSLSVTNENGVPCNVDFAKLEGRKAGFPPLQIITNPANPIPLAFPSALGDSETTTVDVTNVKALLDFAPSELFYQANAQINSGLTSGNNFVMDSSELKVKLAIEVPLFGSASNVLLRDTMDIDLSTTKESQINTATLQFNIVNQMPLDGVIQFFLTDENYAIIDTILDPDQTYIIKGSTVDSSGELKQPGVYKESVEIDANRIGKIFDAKHIILVAAMETSKDTNGNFPNVKFKSTYKLAVSIGILANLKLTVN